MIVRKPRLSISFNLVTRVSLLLLPLSEREREVGIIWGSEKKTKNKQTKNKNTEGPHPNDQTRTFVAGLVDLPDDFCPILARGPLIPVLLLHEYVARK